MYHSYKQTIQHINKASQERKAFFFALDYEQEEGIFLQQDDVNDWKHSLNFCIGVHSSPHSYTSPKIPQIIKLSAESLESYRCRFETVYRGLAHGDSFLTNLTLRSHIHLDNGSLEDIYAHCQAPYKLLIPNKLVCFSPECFIKIKNDEISTYPMKGTIDASLNNAAQILLNDYKEHCEHCTIVDLMRNDLSRVASRVRVKRFKYLSKVKTRGKDILQMSSEVVGHLDKDWHKYLGDIIDQLLPAGSISGAPKEQTCRLIASAEEGKRSYYTGVCGYYDGQELDSCVLIRFIEQESEQYYYRSGGGITINSSVESEYQECLDKIYLPL